MGIVQIAILLLFLHPSLRIFVAEARLKAWCMTPGSRKAESFKNIVSVHSLSHKWPKPPWGEPSSDLYRTYKMVEPSRATLIRISKLFYRTLKYSVSLCYKLILALSRPISMREGVFKLLMMITHFLLNPSHVSELKSVYKQRSYDQNVDFISFPKNLL